ncbi:MAG: DEAD/DEAH box helicase [Sulfuricaulis sp.]|nr:DEAD/DEAH box helicase [Sulfuricaulis sp.]
MLLFTDEDLQRVFLPAYLKRGRDYQAFGRVKKLTIDNNGRRIGAAVQGGAKRPYRTDIILSQTRKGVVRIEGSCSCPMVCNCKHVAATLLEALERQEPEDSEETLDGFEPAPVVAPARPALNDAVQSWLENLARAAHGVQPAGTPDTPERLLYLLKLERLAYTTRAVIEMVLVRPRQDGGYGKAERWNGGIVSHARFVSDADRDLLRWLEALRAEQPGPGFGVYPLRGSAGAHVLARLIATGRCHWQNKDAPLLQPGEPRDGTPAWRIDNEGRQHLVCQGNADMDAVLPLSPPWYVDAAHAQCGPLKTGLPDALAEKLFTAPALAPEDAEPAYAALRRHFSAGSPTLPTVFEPARVERPKPVPVLHLFRDSLPVDYGHQWQIGSARLDLPLAALAFDYAGTRIETGDADEFRTRVENGQLLRLARDAKAESKALKLLGQYGFIPVAELPDFGALPKRARHAFILDAEEDRDAALLRFSMEDLPALRAQGWRIDVDADYPYRVAEAGSDWFADIGEEGSGIDWFGLELGVTVDGARVNLLPMLVEWLRSGRLNRQTLAELTDKDHVIARLPDGRLLPIPYPRVRAVLSVLTELYDETPLDANGRLKLARAQAGALSALEADLGAPLVWAGGERLRQLALKLRDFHGVQPVTPPAGLRTELRSYQRDGLDWLAFLREYEFGGVLADDMGLGKTVQALAYLQTEKEAGRLDRPALVVAPTSLMTNWRREADRFTPGLRVLTLHGAARHHDFARIAAHDLVLTTYALLSRDAEALSAQEYHAVILDEAQAIKNPKAKAAQIVRRLKTRQRLCLTGTPMENHLGELWSLFHFLMPGLLGDERRFKRLYRTPIEKHGDTQRRAALARRIAPFMLRRTKEQVAKELPPKTEIVRAVEIEGDQRDLYESIRLAMNEKVRREIEKKGLARSQIVILDALLKLRQVCCDPRLLKLESAKQVKRSAKLELLMDMLPELIEEGRRILLFSQFTSMLALIERELSAREISYVLLTGNTRDRAAPIDRFQSGAVPLFLISLKAGGTGLNLTAADTVIHYDPWWNPAVERQATDRAHRIGQDKNVFVYKLITQGTVEEKISALQARKQALADGLYGKPQTEGPAFTAQDLELLFAAPA